MENDSNDWELDFSGLSLDEEEKESLEPSKASSTKYLKLDSVTIIIHDLISENEGRKNSVLNPLTERGGVLRFCSQKFLNVFV